MVLINTYNGEEIHYNEKKFIVMGFSHDSEDEAISYIDEKKKRDEEHSKKQSEKKKEEDKLIFPFKIVMANPSYFILPIKHIKGLVNEVTIKITAEKLSIKAMDPSNVSMVIYELLAESAVEWTCEEANVNLNLSQFYSFLKNCNENDMLIFERKEGNKNSTLVFKGKNDVEYNIPFYELDEREYKIPNLVFTSESLMLMSDFKKVITFANEVAESIKIEVTNGKITFSAKDDETEFKCSVLNGKDVETKGVSVSKYSIEYLKMFPLTCLEMVKIEGGSDYPLRVSMRQMDRFSLTYILAPRIDSE